MPWPSQSVWWAHVHSWNNSHKIKVVRPLPGKSFEMPKAACETLATTMAKKHGVTAEHAKKLQRDAKEAQTPGFIVENVDSYKRQRVPASLRLSAAAAHRMAELEEGCRQVVGWNSTTGVRHGPPAPEGRCVPRMCHGCRLCATSPLSGWYCRCDARHAHHLFIHHGGPRCVGRPRLHQLDNTPCPHVRLCQRCCLRSCGCPCGKQTHYGW